ncbi:MAG TPA: glycoside hydrolase family 2 TIM barrel-domain containing protein [Tepidisphaeraceae bacterium]|nr:glycoside hydrolase family 2 TIM barrel-domain containing protein [Tepidisphaeraceae bacterium]
MTAPPDRPPQDFLAGSRKRVAEPVSYRVRRDGKFFRLGDEKFTLKGVTYGPLAGEDGSPFASIEKTRRDFELIKALNANCIRIYHTPEPWFLELAVEFGLKIFLDVAWSKHVVFTEDQSIMEQARHAVRDAARSCGNHPAIFAISVVNEIPPDIVRYLGAQPIAHFVDELCDIVKALAPDCLVTFANFPTTEYLQPRDVDFVTFNVYLHDPTTLRNYLMRLQHIAGEKPLVLGEYGIDSMQEDNEDGQAKRIGAQIASAYEEGVAGAFVFAFTDEWHVHGYTIDNWMFGLTRADRSLKSSYFAIQDVFARAPQTTELSKLPKVSVIICSYNGASTVES